MAWRLGANMSARQSLVERLGAFDPLLGPGSPFRAGEEPDLAIRALAAAYKNSTPAQGRRPTGLGLVGCMLAAPIHRSNGGSICTQRLVAPQNSGVNR